MRSAAGSSELVPRTAPLRCAFLLGVCARSCAHLLAFTPSRAASNDCNQHQCWLLKGKDVGAADMRGGARPPVLHRCAAEPRTPSSRKRSAGPAAGRAGAERCEGLTPERAGAVVQLAEQAAEPRELAVRRREAASDRRQ